MGSLVRVDNQYLGFFSSKALLCFCLLEGRGWGEMGTGTDVAAKDVLNLKST